MRALQQASWRIARYRLTRLPRPLRRYARKFSGEGAALLPRPQWQVIVLAWLGACIALATLGLLTVVCHAPFLIAPFGASVVLLFGHPDSPLTQPRNVVGGHLLGGVIGLTAGMLPTDLSYAPPWLVMALAVAHHLGADESHAHRASTGGGHDHRVPASGT